MLGKAYEQLQPRIGKGGRFQPLKADVSRMGNQTFLQNFKAICDQLNRDPHHVLKFISKELATAATQKDTYVVFQGRFSENQVQRLVSRYISDFVVCPVCKLPDTRIDKRGRF
ncbi:translation initiation factor IF-2 subunit beta, partial [bacterium]